MPWHTDLTCDEYEEEQRERRMQEEASERLVDETSKACPNPKCGIHIEKTTGCDHMTCKWKSLRTEVLTDQEEQVRSVSMSFAGFAWSLMNKSGPRVMLLTQTHVNGTPIDYRFIYSHFKTLNRRNQGPGWIFKLMEFLLLRLATRHFSYSLH